MYNLVSRMCFGIIFENGNFDSTIIVRFEINIKILKDMCEKIFFLIFILSNMYIFLLYRISLNKFHLLKLFSIVIL